MSEKESKRNKIFKLMCQFANVKHTAKIPINKILYYFADASISVTDYTETRAIRSCVAHLVHNLDLDERLIETEIQHLLNNGFLSMRNEWGERDGAGHRKNSYELWVSPEIESRVKAELEE